MKNKILKPLIAVIAVLAVAAAAFVSGYFTHKLTRRTTVDSYDWALGIIDKNYYYGNTDDTYSSASVSAIVQTYLDRYSAYYTAEEYKELTASNAGSKTGIGVTYTYVSGKGIYISSVIGNSPAYICGLRAGMFLNGGGTADGEYVAFESSSDFASLVSGADDGEDITLYSGSSSYTVAKSSYTASYTYMCTNSTSWSFMTAATSGLSAVENVNGKMDFLPDGFAYISLSQFYGTAASEFFVLAEKFNASGCTSLILDLRSNGGGYVSVMQEIAGAFAGGRSKTAMIARDKNGGEDVYKCSAVTDSGKRISSDTDVYVLANSGTASASEALIGAMVCYGALGYENIFLSDYSEEYIAWLASGGQEVKTARTFGKGIMQTTYVNARTGEALKLTTAQIYWPDGTTCIHDNGSGGGLTTAMGCVAVPAEWEHTLDDAELREVVDIIGSR